MTLDPLSLALIATAIAVLIIATTIFVARSAMAQQHLREGAAVLTGLAGTYLRQHPEYQDEATYATLIAAAYQALPAKIRLVIPLEVFANAAGQLIGVVDAALLQEPPDYPTVPLPALPATPARVGVVDSSGDISLKDEAPNS